MEQDHPTYRDYEIGDVTDQRCEFCGGAMSFQYDRDMGYKLSCVVDPNLDHARMLTQEEIEG